MTTKERILALLEENRGTPLSGEVLAEELGVSRTAVLEVWMGQLT